MPGIGRVGRWGEVGVGYRSKDPLSAAATRRTLSDIDTHRGQKCPKHFGSNEDEELTRLRAIPSKVSSQETTRKKKKRRGEKGKGGERKRDGRGVEERRGNMPAIMCQCLSVNL